MPQCRGTMKRKRHAAAPAQIFFSYTVGSNSKVGSNKVGSNKLAVGSNKTLMVGSNIKPGRKIMIKKILVDNISVVILPVSSKCNYQPFSLPSR